MQKKRGYKPTLNLITSCKRTTGAGESTKIRQRNIGTNKKESAGVKNNINNGFLMEIHDVHQTSEKCLQSWLTIQSHQKSECSIYVQDVIAPSPEWSDKHIVHKLTLLKDSEASRDVLVNFELLEMA